MILYPHIKTTNYWDGFTSHEIDNFNTRVSSNVFENYSFFPQATDDRTEVQYTISFNLSNTLLPNNPLGIQMVNLINRDNCKENLGFEQVQRNFFMKSRAVKIETGHKVSFIEIWNIF